MKIDHKCNKTVKYYPSRIYSKERRSQFKSDRNKHRSALSKLGNNILLHLIERAPPSNHLKINEHPDALSKNTLFYKCFSFFTLFAIFLQFGVRALRLFLSDLY